MADDDSEDAAPTNAELAAQIEQQGNQISTILDVLKGTEHKAQNAAQTREEQKLDAPSNVADEVQRQLEDRDRREAASRKENEGETRLAVLEQTVKDLAETPPAAPRSKFKRLIGGWD